jgi:hypothetical protein
MPRIKRHESMQFVPPTPSWPNTWLVKHVDNFTSLTLFRTSLTSQKYWVSGLCPSFGILNAMKHNVSKTGSVSVHRLKGAETYSVGSLRKS